MPKKTRASIRRRYLQWVEDQIEEYKDNLPRRDLLLIADEAIRELRINRKGQYQLTELLLANAVDRKIFAHLKLPGYRLWSQEQQEQASRPEHERSGEGQTAAEAARGASGS